MSNCGCNSSNTFSNLQGPPGNGISSVTHTTLPNGVQVTINMTNGTNSVFLVPAGTPGASGPSIDHVGFVESSNPSNPNTPGQAGFTDTYEIWADVSETYSYGSFIVYNGANGTSTTSSMVNAGSGAGIYRTGTGPDPFSLRSLVSNDGTITITEGPNSINFAQKASPWIATLPAGSSSTSNPIFFISGPFTGITASPGFGNGLEVRVDYMKQRVDMRGSIKFIGSAVIGMNPVGSYNTTSVVFATIPPALAPPIGQQRLVTAQMFNLTRKHASTVLVNVSAGGLALIVDHKLNYIDSNTIISFDNTSYPL